MPENELKIFKYQFILNYLSKNSSNEKIEFIMKVYSMNPSFTNTVFQELMPTLKTKLMKTKHITEGSKTIEVQRTSDFINNEIKIVESMLTGEWAYQ